MIGLDRAHRSESGMVGKLIIGWLIAVVILGVIGLDVVSIVFTRFKLADAASHAATVAATTYRDTKDTQVACQTAGATVAQEDPEAKFTKKGCVVNAQTGQVTISLRKPAKTLLAGRLGFTKHFAHVTATGTEGPATL